jgi:STE24 endopeptidase
MVLQASFVTVLFLVALVSCIAAKFWLLQRQVKAVASHRAEVPTHFKEKISLSSHQKAADYTLAKSKIALLDIALSSLFVVALTLMGGLQAIHDWMHSIGITNQWHPIVTQLAIFSIVVVLGSLIDLPLSLWKQFGVDEKFGFNRMTIKLYLLDTLKSTALGVIVGAPLLALVLWLMQTSGALWWLYTFFVWMGFNLLVMLIFPTFIAPMFNKFVPLQEGEVKTRVEGLLARCGFTSKGLFIMDGSKRSSHGNAYFTGMGNPNGSCFSTP